MQCSEFDALLSQAIDGTLAGERLQAFEAHAGECKLCGPLLQEAEAGRSWLKSLEEVDPPANLLADILLQTTGLAPGRAGVRASWGDRIGKWIDSVLTPVVAVARQPRFAMSFGMAFFTLSVTLSILGVRVGDIRHLDLRPSAVRRTYYETSGRVVKYYENIRFVYEIESRVRQFKQATTPVEDQHERQEDKRKDNKKSSGQPEPRQERNYSREGEQPVFASLPENGDPQHASFLRAGVADLPVVNGATYRRFV